MKFYIFRHGQSTFNTLGKVQGHTNSSILTDLGKKQALTVGQRLIDKNIDVIITSPLKRALETAEICNQLLKKPIVIDDAFIEVNVGEIEGLHHTEVSNKFGEKYDRWRSNSPKYLNLSFDGGESKQEVRDRIFSGLKKYLQTDYQNIAISSHGIMLSQILLALGEDFIEISNSGIICLNNNGSELSLKFEGFI